VRLSIAELTTLMKDGQKDLVMKYLKRLPTEERTSTLNQLVKKLDKLKQRSISTSTTPKSKSKKRNSTTGTKKRKSSEINRDMIEEPNEKDNTHKGIDEKYEFGEIVLGKGGFSIVYLGKNKMTNERVAIKCLDKEIIESARLSSALREPKILMSLNHPSIVRIYDVYQTSRYFYLILEYVENGSLYKALKRYGLFPEDLILYYVKQVLEGLKYLHQHSIMHRDIKSDNILISSELTAKLADFGTAKPEDLGTKLTVIGTPYWMAPEIIELNGGGTKSDIWSLGCTIIELLTGQPPYFDLKKMPALYKIVQDPHPPIPEGITETLNHFLKLCFIKDYETRPSAELLLFHPWLSNEYIVPKSLEHLSQIISEHMENKKKTKKIPVLMVLLMTI